MTPAEREKLRELATKATPGPWSAETWTVECDKRDCDGGCPFCLGEREVTTEAIIGEGYALAFVGTRNADDAKADAYVRTFGLEQFARADAQYIAAASPDVLLSLFDALTAAESRAERAAEEERAKVVAWIRAWSSKAPPKSGSAIARDIIADAIEQGAHVGAREQQRNDQEDW